MKTITTSTGFTIEVDEDNFDDFEFLEILAEAENNVLKIPKVIKMALGEDGKKALCDHVRNEKGRAPTSKVAEIFEEIMDLIGDGGKNS